jgi:hypothetical protein
MVFQLQLRIGDLDGIIPHLVVTAVSGNSKKKYNSLERRIAHQYGAHG